MLTMIVLTLVLWLTSNPTSAETIRFAPLPMENRETLLKQFRPMALFLEAKLGDLIEYVFLDSYKELIEKFRSGKVDLAYLGPLPYIELRGSYDRAIPLVHFNEASGQPMYTCAIVSFADSKLNLAGLKNHRIALTQPLSTCGYLSVNGLLQEHGSDLSQNRYRYLDKHDAVALAVIRGEFDAGGIKTAIGKKYGHLGLNILAETPPLPAFALVANGETLPAEKREKIRRMLTELDPAGKNGEMLASWGENIRYGAVAAADSDYNVVRKLKGGNVIPTTDKD